MIVFPNCKINLGLNIINKREDGYHNLETVFLPVDLKDILEVIRTDKNFKGQHGEGHTIEISLSGLQVTEKVSDNTCLKAYQFLRAGFEQLESSGIIHLHKIIPAGAGLGGGSADGAFMLQLLNKKFNLGLSTEDLLAYALQLGSDCPFFIYNKPCFASGRGEILEPIDLNLSEYKILIVNPAIHISTAIAFSQLTPSVPKVSIREIIKKPVDKWKNELTNDFEEPVFRQHPEIKEIKQSLYNAGAIYSSMSGSGSTVYGIFEKTKDIYVQFPKHYFTREVLPL